VSLFAEEPYKRDHILQKRPIILRSLLIVANIQVRYEVATISRPPYNYRSLLQNIVSFIGLFCKKRPIILRSLIIVATLYTDFFLIRD